MSLIDFWPNESSRELGLVWLFFLLVLSFVWGWGYLRLAKLAQHWPLALPLGLATFLGNFGIFYLASHSLKFSFALGSVVPLLLLFVRTKNSSQSASLGKSKNLVLFTVLVAMTLFVGFPLFKGTATNYWGSSSGDLSEGIDGAAHYFLNGYNLPADHPFNNFTTNPEFERVMLRSQYTTIAAFTLIFGPHPSLGVVNFLNLALLGFSFVSLFYFFLLGLNLSYWPSLTLSVLSSFSGLFAVQFYVGHTGSLLSALCLPLILMYILRPILLRKFDLLSRHQLPLWISIVFLQYTSYPFTLFVTGLLVLGGLFVKSIVPRIFEIFSRARPFNRIAGGAGFVAVYVGLLKLSYFLTASFREQALLNMRPGGEFFRPEGFSIFLTGSGPASPLVKLSAAMFVLSLAVILLGVLKRRKSFFKDDLESVHTRFYLGLLISFSLFSYLFVFHSQNSYYMYKFLYTNQFVVFAAMGALLVILARSSGQISGLLRGLALATFALLFVANQRENLRAATALALAPRNEFGKAFSNLKPFLEKYGSKILLPSLDFSLRYIGRYFSFDQKTLTDVDYVLMSNSAPNASFSAMGPAVEKTEFYTVYDVRERPFIDIKHSPWVEYQPDHMNIVGGILITLRNMRNPVILSVPYKTRSSEQSSVSVLIAGEQGPNFAISPKGGVLEFVVQPGSDLTTVVKFLVNGPQNLNLGPFSLTSPR